MESSSTSELQAEIASLRDKLKQMQMDLERCKRTTNALLEAPRDVVLVLDSDGKFLAANKRGCESLGLELHEIVGRHSKDVLPPDVYESRVARLHKLIQTQKPVSFRDNRAGRIFDQIYYPIFDEDGNVQQLVIYAKDVTKMVNDEKEKKITTENLQKVQRLETIGIMAGGIAHDFNNLLSPIIGYSDLALKRIDPSNKEHRFLQNIHIAALRAKNLVQQILVFSKQHKEVPKPIYLHHFIPEVIKLLKATALPHIKIRREVDKECGTVRADPFQIHQLLMNLCLNAVQAIEDKPGEITISLECFTADAEFLAQHPEQKRTEFALLRIADTGSGMDEQTMTRIFDPFFTTRAESDGTGLGLSVVRGIVSKYEGTIEVSSRIGQGTEFRVYFPSVSASILDDEITSVEIPTGGGEHVLFIDDEVLFAELNRDILSEMGYEVHVYTDSSAALEQFKATPDVYDIVITDMVMPGIQGTELAQEMKKIRPDIPVILTSGFSVKLNDQQLEKSGIDSVILKPIVPEDLNAMIRNMLEISTSSD